MRRLLPECVSESVDVRDVAQCLIGGAAPDQIVKRMAWSQNFAAQNASLEPVKVAQASLGPRLTAPVQSAILAAESRPEGLAILLMSPEFQRR